MTYSISVQEKEVSVSIEPAIPEDIEALIQLNQKWQLCNLHQQTEKGFLGGSFDAATFEYLIHEKAIVVAKVNSSVVAYMLSINHIHTGVLLEHRTMANKVIADGLVPSDTSIAIGIQTAVEELYHGSGLIVLVRNEFKNLIRNRYQYFFTTISIDNIRSFKSATKFGWQVVGQNEHHYYLILKV
ncbi:MAG: hypothetical protein ACOVNY_07660 [Chitinophagaceae bacterium]